MSAFKEATIASGQAKWADSRHFGYRPAMSGGPSTPSIWSLARTPLLGRSERQLARDTEGGLSAAASIMVRVPLAIRRRLGRRPVVTPVRHGVPAVVTPADPALVKALTRAFRYQRLLDEGRYASISEMAKAEKIERGYLGTLLRLTLLAPDILDARHLAALGLGDLLGPLPHEWPSQQSALQESAVLKMPPKVLAIPLNGIGAEAFATE
jgi:hypothetical protein